MLSRFILAALALAGPALARTNHVNCTSFTSVVPAYTNASYSGYAWQTVVWYVPDTLEICEFVECGGRGRPHSNIPGCPIYTGTASAPRRFLETDPANYATKVVTVTQTLMRTSTVGTVTRTAMVETGTQTEETETTAVASGGAIESLSVTGPTESATGSASGTTATPAGAGPTARAGLAAALGIAAAVALV